MTPDGNLLANLPDQVFEQHLGHNKTRKPQQQRTNAPPEW
jgi:hypothetical protein